MSITDDPTETVARRAWATVSVVSKPLWCGSHGTGVHIVKAA